MTKAISFFSILMGVSLTGTWIVLLSTGKVPELVTRPYEAWFLLVAEFLTGLALITSGYGLHSRRSWGLHLELAALGMLLYCSVNYSGVLGQQGNYPALAFMLTVALLSLAATGFCVIYLKNEKLV